MKVWRVACAALVLLAASTARADDKERGGDDEHERWGRGGRPGFPAPLPLMECPTRLGYCQPLTAGTPVDCATCTIVRCIFRHAPDADGVCKEVSAVRQETRWLSCPPLCRRSHARRRPTALPTAACSSRLCPAVH